MKKTDYLQRFIFEDLGVRGEWVGLQDSWQESKQKQNLSSSVQEKLGEALAAAVLMSATIKFKGSLILQAQGNGSLKTLVAQATHDRSIRVLARNDGLVKTGSLSEMMGNGRLVITIEPEKGEPYQGIVALEANTLAEVITTYFLQSEQLQTRVWLFANEHYAAGLFLQELPGQESNKTDWERIIVLANTITKQEMLTLDCEDILHRLFNAEKVRLFEQEPVSFKCTCSRKKIENTLIALGREELASILQEQHEINVDCEFCAEHYHFDAVDIESLLSGSVIENNSSRQH